MTGKKHYVQVNIYGKRLREMDDFETILRDYGCDDFWIGEVPLPNDSLDSGMEDKTIALSSSPTKLAVPRYSTPINSMDRPNLELFGSKMLSNIFESSIEQLFDTIDQSMEITMQDETEIMPISDSFIAPRVLNVEDIISNMLQSVIDIVCETEFDDTTLHDYDANLSTVIQPYVKTNSGSTRVQLSTLSGPHPAKRHSEYVEPVQAKPTIESNKSLSNLKIASIPVGRKEMKLLKRTTSEIRRVEIIPRIQRVQSLVNLKFANNLPEENVDASNRSATQVIPVDESFGMQQVMDGENGIATSMLLSLCETEIDKSTLHDSSSSKLPILFGPHPANRHSEYVSPSEPKPTIQSTMSLINLIFPNNQDGNYANFSNQSATHDGSFVAPDTMNDEDVVESTNPCNITGCIFEKELDSSTFYDCSNSSFADSLENYQNVAEENTSSSDYQLPTLSGPHPANRHSEYVSSVQTKPTIESNKSLSNLKITSIPVGRKERKPLKRTTSEIRRVEMKPRLQKVQSLDNLKISSKPVNKKASCQSVTQVLSNGSTYEHQSANDGKGSISNMLNGVVEIVCETEIDNSTFSDCGNDSFSESSYNNQPYVQTSPNSSNIKLSILCGPHPAKRHSEYVSPVEIKPTLKITRSSKNLKMANISVEREERKPLKRTTSEIRRSRRKAMKLIRNNSINPRFVEIPKTIKPTKVPREMSEVLSDSQTLIPVSDDSVRVYTDLTPVTSDSEQYCEIERNFFDMFENKELTKPTTSRRDILIFPQEERNTGEHEQIEDSLLHESDNNEQESWRDLSIADDHALTNSQKVDACSDESFLGTYDNNLEDENLGNSKQEDVQRKKLGRKPKNKIEMETVHKIKCQFQNCRKVQNWRTKYGKLRLVDHALSHLSNQSFGCDVCPFTCKNTRQINYHYAQKHPDNQMNTFALKTLLSKPVESEELKELWKICYKDSLKLVGEPKLGAESKQKMARRK